MAFLEVVGELFGFSDSKGWTLASQERSQVDITFKGQFVAQNMTESIGAVLGESTTVNKATPNQQWLSGEAEPFSFDTRLFAHDSFSNIKSQVEVLKSFTRRNAKLKRAPTFLFTAGTELSFTCFVRRVDILYDELRPDGSLQGVVARISLLKIQDKITGNAATSLASQIKFAAGVVAGAAGIASQIGRVVNIPGFSLHTLDRVVIVKTADSFESIAKAEYGDALLGDILRRAQPDKVNLKTGDAVQLIEPTEVADITITPQSIALKDTLENRALKEEFFALRDRKTTIFV